MSLLNMKVAVLTGDLVGSRAAGDVNIAAAMEQLSRTAHKLDQNARFSRFRGDGWQMVLHEPNRALFATLLLLADLRASRLSIETRISVGIDGVQSFGTANLSDASGDAFLRSGHGLDTLPRQKRLAITQCNPVLALWASAVFDYIEWQSRGWTVAQAEAIATALRHPNETQKKLSVRLAITRQAMQSRLTSAGWPSVQTALAAFAGTTWDAPND